MKYSNFHNQFDKYQWKIIIESSQFVNRNVTENTLYKTKTELILNTRLDILQLHSTNYVN